MPLSIAKLIFGVAMLLMSLALGPSPVVADCLGQCEAQHQTCLRGCTSANAKQCVDSCFRGSSACRSRCRSDAPVQMPKTGAVSCVQLLKVCVKEPS